ncbi:related to bifunctional 4-hydroxyphenylacetate degradation enzyme [Fusarium torulosum]|uniref:Related to bifunctional 4-hydroxyphenylacetate degradation enzyme n=1 Tax=Fusarium torulosum TaxID=33205 RepID=A0AAE8M9F5_9HYPO|nr:related to bifunctional 4-hydroxyphenylacetate degradation enzyme [Fusarium torulosum]
MAWSRLIRFLDQEDQVRLGDAVADSAQNLASLLEAGNLTANELVGTSLFNAKPTGKVVQVKKLLGPLTSHDVPIIRCVGLNYAKHIKETGRAPPPHPSIFIKPSRSVTGWSNDIPIPKIAQEDQLDYEGELAIVIGKEGKDISAEDALDHVAGYTVANDVSARTWQRDPKFAGEVPQWCFSKGFDSFAPLGPVIVSPSILGAADDLVLQTKVNGEVRQEATTSDLVFGVRRIIAFVSQGTTLEKGSVILTGTPGGVALGMKPPKWLKDGDTVEVSISGIGTIRNKMVFQ